MYSVLIADDENIIRRGFIEFVPWNELGFEVVYDCENGTQVIEYLNTHTVDFILTDIVMLGLTGLDIARYVFENHLNTIVCLVSGHRDFEYARQAMKYNVTHYLTKPTDFGDMIEMIKEVKHTLDMRITKYATNSECERFFLDLCIGKYESANEAKTVAYSLGINTAGIFISPIWITINDFNRYIEQKWQHGKELLFVAVLNFLRDALKDFIIFNITINGSEGLYVIASSSPSVATEKQLCSLLDSASANLCETMNLNISYQIGSIFTDLTDFMECITDKENNIFKKSSSDTLIHKVKSYISLHYSENISLDDAAAYVYVNPSYLSRLFKQYTGENFRDYIIKFRINKAIELINTKKYKIYEISEMCGYSNPKYFTQQFKQITGLSPRQYLSRKG